MNQTESEQQSGTGASKSKGLVKLLVLVAFIVGVIVVVKTTGLDAYIDQERLREWISGYGAWGPVVYMAIYLIAPALFLPGLPITIAGGVLFGPFWGVVYSIFSATGGACLAFLIARYLGREWISSKIQGTNLAKLDQEVEKQGWKIVAFTRLIPIFPFNLLNYAFGLTRIKFTQYAITSFFCMLPACIAYIVFSSSLLDRFKGKISLELVVGISLIVAVSVIPIYYKRKKAKNVEITDA